MKFDEVFKDDAENIVVHRLDETPSGQFISFELSDVKKEMLDGNGLIYTLPKKQPNQPRNERFSRLEMDFGEKVIPREMRINIRTSEVAFWGQIASPILMANSPLVNFKATLTTYYPRKDKDKILHAYFDLPNCHYLGIEKVLSTYDQIFFIDTNCKVDRDGRKLAVTTAIISKPKSLGNIAIHIGEIFEYQSIAYDPPGNPEVHGIWMCFCHIYKDQPSLLERRIALVTDTEYDRIKRWQARSEPFFDGWALPEGIDIFYATADAGGDEFLPNRFIKLCDQASTKKMVEILNKVNRD